MLKRLISIIISVIKAISLCSCENSEKEENRAVYTEYFVSAAKKYDITCIYWDDGGSMKIIDRNTYEWTCLNVRNAIVNASK